ncbi:hypothetical protein BDP81DRAFT_388510 [Colletotrichum phormii]|uniref:Kelch repeat-containing protein n=1 Tax=Colletotrichum phormii TaxID=359342 RepID=A0AAJ0A372_9PEZI|nr:uncharacterized protein BDP81DRAFT_388510 [Colletotrichum phormii]KAK1655596.1 hypothetical protein BDP81DRAFT_388510 [Colletotrichum phormii]
MAYSDRPSSNEIWRFEVDGNGGGTWSQVNPMSVVAFGRLVRTLDASFAQSKDVGYYFGGAATPPNMTSGEIRNTSSTGFGQYGTLVRGSAQFVPFGSGGLLLFLGGAQSRVSMKDWTQMDFNKVTLYHPSTDKWYTQQTTGSRPTGRGKFCVVGASSTNNTYEIFLYGGLSSVTDFNKVDSVSGDVYVLSLPGFVFFKAAGSSIPRADHACVSVADGGRQMLSIGGVDWSVGFPKYLTDPDPWEFGLGIFDMTEMRWSDRYDSQALPCGSPVVVKQWYVQGGLDSIIWASEEVKALFLRREAPDNSTSDPSTTGQPNTTSQSSKPPIGAIVGASIGGVAGLVLVICPAVFFLKRKKRRHQASPQQESGGTLPGSQKPGSEHFGSQGPARTNAFSEGHNTGHFNFVELPAEHSAAELSSAHVKIAG